MSSLRVASSKRGVKSCHPRSRKPSPPRDAHIAKYVCLCENRLVQPVFLMSSRVFKLQSLDFNLDGRCLRIEIAILHRMNMDFQVVVHDEA